jgi:hypothetical protein
MVSRHWSDIVAEKRAIRDAKLAKDYSSNEVASDPRITSADDLQQLAKLLESREITAEAVILAHIAKQELYSL